MQNIDEEGNGNGKLEGPPDTLAILTGVSKPFSGFLGTSPLIMDLDFASVGEILALPHPTLESPLSIPTKS